MHKFCLHTDALLDEWCSCELNTQLLRVIAERAIHHGLVMDGGGVFTRTNEISC